MIQQKWREILMAVFLAATVSFWVYQSSTLVLRAILQVDESVVAWFESDTWRVYENMTARDGDYFRIKVHPLFPLFVYPPTYVFKKLINDDSISAVHLVFALTAFLWVILIYVLLRLIGCSAFESMLCSILAAVSSSSMFWFVIPETHCFGSVSILLAFILVIYAQKHPTSFFWYVAVNILTFSFTITNWMAGITATIVQHPFKRAFKIIGLSLVLATLLWGFQKIIFPRADFFLVLNEEPRFMFTQEAGGPLRVMASFFYHSVIMPAIPFPALLIQKSLPGSASLWGAAAVVLWSVLLALGFWAMVFLKTHIRLRLTLGIVLLGQLGMHLIYGEETFLYAMHFIALLIPIAALSLLTKARPWVSVMIFFLILCVFVNNINQFFISVEFVNHSSALLGEFL